MTYTVTLKAELEVGILYWVTEVSATDEQEALTVAEHRFEAATEADVKWSFTEYEIKSIE